MSGLSALKLVQAKRQAGTSPKHARRQKLSNKLHEQIQLAKAEQAGTQYQPTKLRTVKDEVTGESRKVETPKRIKAWWWPSDGGKLCITVRYGARTLEVIEGKNAIETDSIAGVVTTQLRQKLKKEGCDQEQRCLANQMIPSELPFP